ncbi:hypothetical protein [Priestia flexa]|uniref:hypothetical protein n=1 Tax=Priestia flexa TaxID=86664 RepID=UPI0004734DF6|nr:hypothetical protein [Priestia flexa]
MPDIELETVESTIRKDFDVYVNGFVAQLFSDGIIDEVQSDQLKKYFANPDEFREEIANIAEYYHISNGDVFQLFNTVRVLPTLNYKLDSYDKNKSYGKYISLINKTLHKVRHKSLTRDIISQTISSGTLCGIWVGNKNNPYFYIFDNTKIALPSHREQGQWVVKFDLGYLNQLEESDQDVIFRNLSPFVTREKLNAYKNDLNKRYVYLPKDRTGVIRTHTLKRNQNIGVSWVTQGLFDINHKKKLRDLEKSVANKIINAIAVLTIGSEKNPEYAHAKLGTNKKKKLYSGVKSALEKNNKSGVTVVGIPEYANLDFPDIKSGDSLDPKKFESINNDISSSYGLAPALANGTGSNFASANLNLTMLYKRVGVLLEDVETEVYGKLFNIILPSNQSDNFFMSYDREAPLSLKEKIDVLHKLHSEGFAVKPIIDLIDGVNYESYIEQSIYELDDLKLPEKIRPYQTSYTVNSSGDSGAPTKDDSTNENTIKSKEYDGNNAPES